MKRISRQIYSLIIILIAGIVCTSCADEPLFPDRHTSDYPVNYDENGNLILSVAMEVPDMMQAATRAMGETPDFENLGIYMLVFEEGEGLRQFARLSDKNVAGDDKGHNNDGLVTFNVSLEPTENKVVIHLIATNELEFGTQVAYGMEEQVVPSLYTKNNNEAYWQRVEIGTNIPSREQAEEGFDPTKYNPSENAKASEIQKKMSHVAMIRNFCKVSAKLSDTFTPEGDDAGATFVITGLYLMNTVDRGSVAPYLASYAEDDGFVDFYDERDGRYVGKSYRDITDNAKYTGRMPTGVRLINTVANPDSIRTKSEDASGNIRPVYFYERPARVNSEMRTFAILRIGKNGTDSYYKIDLGQRRNDDPNGYDIGLFEYYNLLRNFHYEININKITGEGYSSLEKAASGQVFNNVSASVEARSMKSISDGEDWIYVDKTSYVFTRKGEELTIRVQFREDVYDTTQGDNNIHNEKLKVAAGTPQNVFRGEDITFEDDPNDRRYKLITIKCNGTPGKELESQELYVYRGNKASDGATPEYGLYRVITIYMHEPWEFYHIDTFPGLWEDINEMPYWEWTEDNYREIGQYVGAPLTLFFELPPDLPQAIFPLDFIIESDRQNIQNAYIGNAVVRSVSAAESLFADRGGNAPQSSRIQYVKTVTWFDYNGTWDEEYNPGQGSRIVRCRFRCITDLRQDGIGGLGDNSESTTMLRVKSEPSYFGKQENDGNWIYYAEDGFKRKLSTSDPTPRFWNFSEMSWDNILIEMMSRYDNKPEREGQTYIVYNSSNNLTDQLIFIDEGETERIPTGGGMWGNQPFNVIKPTLTSGTDSFGRYVQTNRDGDKLMTKLSYDTNNERILRIVVVSRDTNGELKEPIVKTTGGGFTHQLTRNKKEENDNFVYEITVPSSITSFDLEISGKNTRFYKIDFYPRFDEFKAPDPKPRRK